MGALVLITVPAALLVVSGLLALSTALERLVLSPRAMIRSAARARRTGPEFAEVFVARQAEHLLRDAERR